MDACAAELLNHHQGSLELEELDARGANLPPGAMSSNGAIEHIGEGVQVGRTDRTKVDKQIDPDSLRTPHTITRVDQRATARLAVKTVDDPINFPRVTVIGQPGIGKTRGGLTYVLEELLWRGEAVLRVGHKDAKAYLFLPDENGKYRVWRTSADDWNRSEVAADRGAYALIDPPEIGVYADAAACHVIKFASNNAKKHYENYSKYGHMLVSALATIAEVLVMVPILWNGETTPHPDQVAGNDSDPFVSLEAKQDEIKKRCELAGTILRAVFNHEQFVEHLDKVVTHAQETALEMDATRFLAHVWGDLTQADSHPSSTSSLDYLLNSVPGDPTKRQSYIKFSPTALHVLRLELKTKLAATDPRRPFCFEDTTTYILRSGAYERAIEGTSVRPENLKATAKAILDLPDSGERLVIASPNFPVLDQATSRFEWYNAKAGKAVPTVKAGAFHRLMTKELKMA